MTQQRVSPISVTSVLPAVPVLSLQAALGQSANLTEWKNSSGTVLGSVTTNGSITAVYFGSSINNTSYIQPNLSTGAIGILTAANANIGLIIRGNAAQTADLQQWQNSAGTVLARVFSDGAFISPDIYSNSYSNTATANNARLELLASGPRISTNITTNVALIVRNLNASATADLQQWQNSAGTALAAISAAGILNIVGSGTLAQIQSSTDASRILWVKGLSNSVRIGTTTGAATIEGVDATNGQTSYQPLNVGGSTINLQTGAANRISIDGSGNIAVGGVIDTAVNFRVNRNVTGGTSAHQITASGTIQSDVTSTAYYLRTFATTQATSFTLTNLFHYHADGASIGAGSTITNNFGFTAPSSMTYGTNNFGFYGNIASASNRWNFYANGTAANYFAGQTTVGSTSLNLGSSSAAQQFGVVASAATTVGAVIRGAASQTANLQEWQNSAGTVLALVNSSGSVGINTSSIAAGVLNVKGTDVARIIYVQGATYGLRIGSVTSGNLGATVEAVDATNGNTSYQPLVLGGLPVIITLGGTERFRFDANNNLLIGTTSVATSSATTIHIANGTAPSANPTGGGVLYVEAGALKYRGSSGTVTTIANA